MDVSGVDLKVYLVTTKAISFGESVIHRLPDFLPDGDAVREPFVNITAYQRMLGMSNL